MNKEKEHDDQTGYNLWNLLVLPLFGQKIPYTPSIYHATHTSVGAYMLILSAFQW